MTRLAVPEVGPTVIGLGRAVIPGIISAIILYVRRAKFPDREHWFGIFALSMGTIVLFPYLSSAGLKTLPANHGAVINGFAPAATALATVLLAHEKPPRVFWVSCFAGFVAVLVFAWAHGASRFEFGDWYLLGAIAVLGPGYAFGGKVSKSLGSINTMCWALALTAPFVAIPALMSFPDLATVTWKGWLGIFYTSIFSVFLGMFAWLRGLAIGGVLRVSQVQVLQPVLAILWSALLLGEKVGVWTVGAALVVVLTAALAQRSRLENVSPG